jgi:GTP-binding protein HflX
MIDRELSADREIVTPKIDLSDGATIAWLYRHGEVLNRSDDDSYAHFRVSLTPADTERLGRLRRTGSKNQN